MGHPLKVLYIDTGADFWGGQRSLYELICHLNRNLYEPIVAVPEDSPTEDIFKESAKVNTFPASSAIGKRSLRPFSILRSIYVISRLIKDSQPDIIHANTFLGGLMLSLIPSVNTPWVLHQRDLTDHKKLTDWVTRRAAKIIAVSRAAAAHLGRSGLKRNPSIIPDGVSLSFTDEMTAPGYKPTLREKHGIKDDTIVVGAVGTISEQKSQHEILQAANRLRDVPGLHFLCIGEPYREDDHSYFGRLKELRTELDIEHLVSFEGYTDDLADIYGSIDILAHPANNEGLGRVIIEAMGAGVPVLARNCCGPAEIITNAVDGILCDPSDSEDFVKELMKLVECREFRMKLAEAAREKIVEKYTIEKSTRQIEEVYNELLATDRNL